MDNTALLAKGTAKARQLIVKHILEQLVTLAKRIIRDVMEGRVTLGHNMTGNTINAYAAGVYSEGVLIHTETPQGSIPGPLRRKLGLGERFAVSSQRWDGDVQEHTFKARVSTNGTSEPERSLSFLESYRAPSKGFALVVCNGVEYATYQENEMNIDVLTQSFNTMSMFSLSSFKPMSA